MNNQFSIYLSNVEKPSHGFVRWCIKIRRLGSYSN